MLQRCRIPLEDKRQALRTTNMGTKICKPPHLPSRQRITCTDAHWESAVSLPE